MVPPPSRWGRQVVRKVRFAMIFAHVLMGKLNLEQSTFFLDPPNRPILFGLMLVAAHVVPLPVPWAQRQHRWPQRPQWPLLPVLEWRPGATQFQTLKLAKPNMRQLNAAPHGTNDARLGPSGVL